MGMTKNIEIDGKQVSFKASAVIPRIYRIKFHRDIYKDLEALGKAVGNGNEAGSNLDMFSLEMFENIAYIMAKHADPSIPDSPEEWLDEFNTFGMVNDMYVESGNDDYQGDSYKATQKEMDLF